MTAELVSQRERLVQTERVAAWRELARRLAHELKNPLFPLQLTVENLIRARALAPEEFDEVFRESTQTLSMEIANLKTIIGRFSDFSKMPKPELERIDAKDVIERVRSLYFTAKSHSDPINATHPRVQLDRKSIALSRTCQSTSTRSFCIARLSNLVLNAMDAMPDGGTLTLSAKTQLSDGPHRDPRLRHRRGMTPEECERLFTPYYTTKQHGTGLGLAIVQSVIADHAGTIAVESRPASGATFVITLPRSSA
jgi:two-component system nitrogen regulation sensor histidine kinase NtrY